MPESSKSPPAASAPDHSPNHALKHAEDVATFRHDLRNALAPALLCADVLGTHTDPSVRQNARTIVTALENALKLLKKSTSSR
ncbi:hypothetical protein [Gluconobacter sp.]|uniref:hypothetical protein n=1 Tax=Gluconobacter sp. TaxID=1876758 RepID=UPI0039EB9D11